jgi:hypothetical protein
LPTRKTIPPGFRVAVNNREALTPGGLEIQSICAESFADLIRAFASGRCPLSEVERTSQHVRFTPKSGHSSAQLPCPLCAKSGLMRCSNRRQEWLVLAASICRSTATGSVNANVEPWPDCDSTQERAKSGCAPVSCSMFALCHSGKYREGLSETIPGSEMIIQTDAGDLDFVPEGCVEGSRDRPQRPRKGGESCDPHRFGAQINKLIFDLCTPMLVKQPFGPTTGGPARPYLG